MATVKQATSIDYSGDWRVDSLLSETLIDWNYLTPARDCLYFTFDLGSEIVEAAGSSQLSPFTGPQKNAAYQILTHAAELTGIRFIEITDPAVADLHFGTGNLLGADLAGLCRTSYAYTYTANDILTGFSGDAFVFLDNQEFSRQTANPTPGSPGYECLLHEIGHALGLGHPFEGAYPLPAQYDNTANTVMSYTDRGGHYDQFRPFDRLALDWIYGRDGLGGSYGFNSWNGPTLTPPEGYLEHRFTAANDEILDGLGPEWLNGLGGRDTLICPGELARYRISHQGDAYYFVEDLQGWAGKDLIDGIEKISFSDYDINLTVQSAARNMAPADLMLLEELYLAFFNRTPDASGLEYWIGRQQSGTSLDAIADSFYAAGVEAGDLTGYHAGMTPADFINKIYQNVLGRSEGADPQGLAYWSAALAEGKASRGALVKDILQSAHTFKADPDWGWVADLLDNKAQLANLLAVEMGLDYPSPEEAIRQGMAIAAAVSPDSIAPALALIGIAPETLAL